MHTNDNCREPLLADTSSSSLSSSSRLFRFAAVCLSARPLHCITLLTGARQQSGKPEPRRATQWSARLNCPSYIMNSEAIILPEPGFASRPSARSTATVFNFSKAVADDDDDDDYRVLRTTDCCRVCNTNTLAWPLLCVALSTNYCCVSVCFVWPRELSSSEFRLEVAANIELIHDQQSASQPASQSDGH